MSDDQPWLEEKPWNHDWRIIEQLGGGGQGKTFIVAREEDTSNDRTGVLKLLIPHKESDPKARARMFREVAALRAIHAEGGAVPAVLKHNTDDFEKPNVRLFLVMSHIRGTLLRKWIEEKKPMGVSESLRVALRLCQIMRIPHRLGYVHRDVKPDNIMVQDAPEFPYLVMLDFGLSFNKTVQPGVSGINEGFANSFLALPELRGPDDTKHDHRSDLTCIIGVLYYCLTGHNPASLLDEKNRAPHRGPRNLAVVTDNIQRKSLESLLDIGFQQRIEDRFQTLDQLEDRLNAILHPNLSTRAESLAATIERAKAVVRQNRSVVLEKCRKLNEAFQISIIRMAEKKLVNIEPFTAAFGGGVHSPEDVPPGVDSVSTFASIVLQLPAIEVAYHVQYQLFAEGLESVAWRRVIRITPGPHRGAFNNPAITTLIHDWMPLIRQPIDAAFDGSLLESDLEAMIGDSLERLAADADSGAKKES